MKWYLAPNARRVLGTDKAGVYAFATNTPSGEIFTGGSKVRVSDQTSSKSSEFLPGRKSPDDDSLPVNRLLKLGLVDYESR